MKNLKLILILVSLSLVTNIYARQNETKKFIDTSVFITSQESVKVYNSEPLQNIVGKESKRFQIKFGISTIVLKNTNNKYLDLSKLEPFIYGWLNDQELNNEKGIGIGATYSTRRIFEKYRLRLSGKAGFGWQSVKGKSLNLNSTASTITYATNKITYGNYKGVYTEDTTVIEMGLSLGVSREIFTKNLTIYMDYTLNSKFYNFAYYIEGTDNGQGNNIGTKLSGVSQFTDSLEFGLSYRF